MRSPAWRWLFWLLIITTVAKIYLWLKYGSVIWFAITSWFFWLMIVIWSIFLVVYYLVIFSGQWSANLLLKFFLLIIIGGVVVGWSTHAVYYVGKDGTAGGANAKGGLVACLSTPQTPIKTVGDYRVKMYSTKYTIDADGKATRDYNATGMAIKTFSIAALDNEAQAPEGDVFFTVDKSDGGFITGAISGNQICDSNNMTLAGNKLMDPPPSTAAAGSDVSGTTYYLWKNHRATEPGTYYSYGYIYDKGTWQMVARSEPFTLTK